MSIKPLNDNVIIKPLKESEVTKSGIVLPETVDKERPERGEVIAVGPGKMLASGQRAPLGVQVGQKVLFKKYSPDEIKIDNQELLVVNESEIIAILD